MFVTFMLWLAAIEVICTAIFLGSGKYPVTKTATEGAISLILWVALLVAACMSKYA